MRSSRVLRLIAAREMKARLRNRPFLIGNAVTMAVILGLILILPRIIGDDPLPLGLVNSEGVTPAIENVSETLDVEIDLQRFDSIEAAEAALEADEVVGVLVDGVELVVLEELNPDLAFIVTAASADVRFAGRIEAAGVSEDQAALIGRPDQPISVRSLVEPEQLDEDEGFFGGMGAASAGVVLLFMAINLYGNTVLTGVVEEKTSRVVEVVLATVRPWQMMAGKLLGLGLLGLAQLGLLIGLGLIAATVSDLVEVTGEALLASGWVVIWFILGFALFSTVYAMGGAMASRAEEAQSAAIPIALIVLSGYFAAFVVVLPEPESTLATVLSVIPLFAPFTMPALIALGKAAVWQIVLSVVLTMVSTVLIVGLAGRIYAGAILQSGERVKLRQALRSSRDVIGG